MIHDNTSHSTIDKISLSLNSPESIKASSSVKVTDVSTIADTQSISKGSTRDTRLGATNYMLCSTCGNDHSKCPCGHFGFYELSEEVYNFQFIKHIANILQSICPVCFKIALTQSQLDIVYSKKGYKLSDLNTLIQNLITKNSGMYICPHCKQGKIYKIAVPGKRKVDATVIIAKIGNEDFRITAAKANRILSRIEKSSYKYFGMNEKLNSLSSLIYKNVVISGNPARPFLNDEKIKAVDNDFTILYNGIINNDKKYREFGTALKEQGYSEEEINDRRREHLNNLSRHVNSLFSPDKTEINKRDKELKSVELITKSKTGRVQKNLIAKRIFKSGRSVISGDPNLGVDEVGIPLLMLKTITFPETVNKYNVEFLRSLIRNGADTYPGANSLTKGCDTFRLDNNINLNNIELEYGDVVHRHLLKGDYVMFNRQPTLHHLSMSGLKVVPMPENNLTIRINLSNTSPLNADFDGDESNIIVPSSYAAMAEIKYLVMHKNNLISSQSQSPIMGVIQDSLLGSFLLSNPDLKFSKREAMYILRSMFVDRGKKYYTGLDILSEIIPKNIFYSRPSNLFNDRDYYDSDFKYMQIKHGKIQKGVLDSSALGVGKHKNLIHIINNDISKDVASKFLNDIQKITNNFIMTYGCTLGFGDIYIHDVKLKKRLNEINNDIVEYANMLEAKIENKTLLPPLNWSVSQFYEQTILIKCTTDLHTQVAEEMEKITPLFQNNFMNCIHSGSKGNPSNLARVSWILGQQMSATSSERAPKSVNGRVSHNALRYDRELVTNGFVFSSYVKGLSIREFLAHIKTGREGMIDTALKTKDSGYSTKKTVKMLEDTIVNKNLMTVNGFDGNIFQLFAYYDLYKSEALERVKMDFHLKPLTNDLFYVKGDKVEKYEVLKQYNDELVNYKQLLLGMFKKFDDNLKQPFDLDRIIQNVALLDTTSKFPKPFEYVEMLNSLKQKMLEFFTSDKVAQKALEHPLLLTFIYMHSKLNPKQLKEKGVRNLIYLKSMIIQKFKNAIIDINNMIGGLSAVSITEVITQLTLNTFHAVSASNKNITSGFQRLKEIIEATTKNVKSNMTIFVKDGYTNDMIKTIKNKLSHIVVKDLLDSVTLFYEDDHKKGFNVKENDYVKKYIKLNTYEPFVGFSNLALYIKFDKRKLVFNYIDVLKVKREIKKIYGSNVYIIHSEIDAYLLLRFKFDNENFQNEQNFYETFMNTLEKIVVRGVSGIYAFIDEQRSLKSLDETGNTVISERKHIFTTNGSNIKEMFSYKFVDSENTYSNNIHEVNNVLGIFAARNLIIQEVRSEGALSNVDYRHFALLADILTSRGYLIGTTSSGLSKLTNSIFQQVSFENIYKYINKAAFKGIIQSTKNQSSLNIALGNKFSHGTGSNIEVFINPSSYIVNDAQVERLYDSI